MPYELRVGDTRTGISDFWPAPEVREEREEVAVVDLTTVTLVGPYASVLG